MSRALHLLCADTADLYGNLLALWKAWRAPKSPGAVEPLHVVVPTPAHRAAAKRFLLAQGQPLFHVAFLLPNHLRTLLAERLLDERAPLWGREELDFLLTRMAREAGDDSPLCRGLAQNAAPLRRALDELAGAGHGFGALLEGQPADQRAGLAALRRAWDALERELAPGLRARIDRRLGEAARRQPGTMPGRLVVFGGGVRQTADFALLEAALRAWKGPAVLSLLAAAGQETTEGPWLSLVEAALPDAAAALPGMGMEAHGTDAGMELPLRAVPTLRFLAVSDRGAAAALAVRQARAWLAGSAKPEGARIGLVFPAASPVVSRVAQLLRADGIPFHSAFPTLLPLRFEQALLRDWLALQRGGLWAEPFLLFWRKAVTVPPFAARFGEPQLWGGELGDRFAEAHDRLLSDDVAVLAAWLGTHGKPLPALQKFMAWWRGEGAWPDAAPLAEYVARFGAQLDLLVGPNLGKPLRGFLAGELSRLAGAWDQPVDRAAACTLLESFVARPDAARDANDAAPVHLVTPEMARAVPWDHLLLAELEEGRWPRLDAPASLLDDALRERLNARARIPSPAGGGETVFAPGAAPLLTAADHHRLARETFSALLEGASGETALLAAAWDEIEANRQLYPSPFYREAWEAAHGKPWRDLAPSPDPAPPLESAPADPSVEAARMARHARRNGQQPFGEYSFALRRKPAPRPLSAKAAEETLADPATAWFKHFLKIPVERPSWDVEEVWPRFQGIVLHRLFERALASLRPEGALWLALPPRAEWPGTLGAALDREAARAEAALPRAFADAGKEAPAWWDSEWPRLRAALGQLLAKLAAQLPDEYTHLASELKLDLPAPPEGSPLPALPWHSRADLIALDGSDLKNAARALVIDFKTGANPPDFRADKAATEGAYFQLLAYAALLRAEAPHLKETSVLVLHRGPGKLAKPVEIDPASPSYAPLWAALRAAWEDGVFGQVLAVRDRFQKTSKLPLATLEVPTNLLAEKWAQTPGLREWERRRE